MVQIIKERRPQSTSERFANAFTGLGQSIAQGVPEEMLNRQENKAAERFGADLSGLRDPNMRRMALQGGIEQQSQSNKFSQEYKANQENYDVLKNNFGKKFADVWMASPQGAKTELTRAALEARARGINLDEILGEVPSKSAESPQQLQEDIGNQEEIQKPKKQKEINAEIKKHIESQDAELIPSERVARGKERYDTGLKQYQVASEKLRGMARDKERLDILESLNKTSKLPENLGRLNVDKEGNLRLPFLASAETQRFVKTLNEFSAGAKDSYGSRVTNFDLAQYMKRYPTLLNTDEGRKQLLDQMKVVNQINSVFYKNLKGVYDKAGGVRKIDSDAAERFAEELSDEKIGDLSKKFNEIGQFSSQPNASEFKGRKIRNKETGEILVSDGENWIPEE